MSAWHAHCSIAEEMKSIFSTAAVTLLLLCAQGKAWAAMSAATIEPVLPSTEVSRRVDSPAQGEKSPGTVPTRGPASLEDMPTAGPSLSVSVGFWFLLIVALSTLFLRMIHVHRHHHHRHSQK